MNAVSTYREARLSSSRGMLMQQRLRSEKPCAREPGTHYRCPTAAITTTTVAEDLVMVDLVRETVGRGVGGPAGLDGVLDGVLNGVLDASVQQSGSGSSRARVRVGLGCVRMTPAFDGRPPVHRGRGWG
jgi:hypothetical protein